MNKWGNGRALGDGGGKGHHEEKETARRLGLVLDQRNYSIRKIAAMDGSAAPL